MARRRPARKHGAELEQNLAARGRRCAPMPAHCVTGLELAFWTTIVSATIY